MDDGFDRNLVVDFSRIFMMSQSAGAHVVVNYLKVILMGYLHNLTNISENSVGQHLKVSYNNNRIDPICESCVVQHNVSDFANRP
jgi:hypothetical protein